MVPVCVCVCVCVCVREREGEREREFVSNFTGSVFSSLSKQHFNAGTTGSLHYEHIRLFQNMFCSFYATIDGKTWRSEVDIRFLCQLL